RYAQPLSCHTTEQASDRQHSPDEEPHAGVHAAQQVVGAEGLAIADLCDVVDDDPVADDHERHRGEGDAPVRFGQWYEQLGGPGHQWYQPDGTDETDAVQ